MLIIKITNVNNILITKYEKACSSVFLDIAKLNKKNKIRENLKSPVKLMGFKRLTN